MISLKTTQKTDQLKEMYGKNLVEAIWPYVLKNEIDAFAIDQNLKLKPEELDITLAYNQPVITPIYDSTGSSIITFKVIADPIDPGRFTDVQLIQDWFYDHKKNKVYSYITELVLYLIKFNKKEDEAPVAVLRLVLNQ
jgi:hypothetical protein